MIVVVFRATKVARLEALVFGREFEKFRWALGPYELPELPPEYIKLGDKEDQRRRKSQDRAQPSEFIVLIIDQVFPTGKKSTTQPKEDSKEDSNNGRREAQVCCEGSILDWIELLIFGFILRPAEDNKKKENSSPKPETKKSK
ncbi:hypothetical protein GCK32_001237 [Trichostrongylus colubriformis]|uniref:Uncharacterized protein n=1 Tax=Trichostrongylus colubriformis TaxID=6319 RepID=A0AAN8F9L6_TRICO